MAYSKSRPLRYGASNGKLGSGKVGSPVHLPRAGERSGGGGGGRKLGFFSLEASSRCLFPPLGAETTSSKPFLFILRPSSSSSSSSTKPVCHRLQLHPPGRRDDMVEVGDNPVGSFLPWVAWDGEVPKIPGIFNMIRLMGADSGLIMATSRLAETMLPGPMLISFIAVVPQWFAGLFHIFESVSRIFNF